MNTISIVPEEIIITWLAEKFSFRKSELTHPMSFLRVLPRKELEKLHLFVTQPDLTPDFLEKYRRIIQAVLSRQLIKTFQGHDLFITENDQTRVINITDLDFWKGLQLRFTPAAVKIIWQLIISELIPIRHENILLSPGDIIFLSQIRPEFLRSYPLEKLEESSWQLTGYFILKLLPEVNLKTVFPYRYFFEKYRETSYPLRFLLLESAAEYYQQLCSRVENFISTLSDSEESPDGIPESYYFISNAEINYGFGLVEKAFNYWCNEGLVFDESKFLRGHAERFKLFQSIKVIRQLVKSIGRMERENE